MFSIRPQKQLIGSRRSNGKKSVASAYFNNKFFTISTSEFCKYIIVQNIENFPVDFPKTKARKFSAKPYIENVSVRPCPFVILDLPLKTHNIYGKRMDFWVVKIYYLLWKVSGYVHCSSCRAIFACVLYNNATVLILKKCLFVNIFLIFSPFILLVSSIKLFVSSSGLR